MVKADNTISVSVAGLAMLALVLLGFAAVNLFGTFKPVAAANDQLANRLNQSFALSFSERIKVYADLRTQQELLLIQNPIEPYAWMRLAYLRNITLGNRRHAFEALKFADVVAHPDNVGGLERVLMWHDYADVQNEAERTHIKDMWRAAYRQNWYNLMYTAKRRELLDDLKAAVMEDPELAEMWNKGARK